MNMQDLGFLNEEATTMPMGDNNPSSSHQQTPLTDQETTEFYRAMRDELGKRQTLERELAELRTEKSIPNTMPDRDLGLTVYANNLRVSRRFAEREYGREVVSAVHDWAAAKCDADPAFNARMRASDDPYEAAKQTYDLEQAARSDTEHSRRFAPPRSLVDAPGNGAVGKPHVPVGDGNAYESLFK